MSGAILNVVYGIPLCSKFGQPIRMSEELQECIENEDDGFRQYYSAYDESPTVFGVNLCNLHEGGVAEVSEIRLEATSAELAEFQSKWDDLEEPVRDELNKLGSPRIFIIWSNS
jgi:hypothetical protein